VRCRPRRAEEEPLNYLDVELASLVVDDDEDAKPTAGFQRVIQRAVIHVQSSGREEVTGANVLVAIFSERESHAAYFLQEQDMTRYDAVNFIAHGIAKKAGASEPKSVKGASAGSNSTEDDGEKPNAKTGGEALEAYCVDLNEKARQGKVDPLIGRANEVERAIQILCRRTKNNPLLVGDPGVGKTAIAEGLARKIVTTRSPKSWPAPPSTRSTWARCWPAPAIAATSRNASSRWSRNSRTTPTRCCSSTRSTP
jgi:ATP-dependent Clp protease ATP-binding subunit ClpA